MSKATPVNNLIRVLTLVAVVLWVYACSGIFEVISSPPVSHVKKPEMKGSVWLEKNRAYIKNEDDKPWKSCKASIVTGGIFDSGYALNLPVINVGKTISRPLSDFANSDGERFNIFAKKPDHFVIWCVSDKFESSTLTLYFK